MTVEPAPAPSPPEATESTRDRLLDAAEKLFAERGFLAASVRDITAAAGCNVAAVNYHFGGKESLYHEMFRRRLATLREQRTAGLRRALEEAGGAASLELVLRSFTTAFLAPLSDRETGSRLLELISREMLERQLPPDFLLNEMIEPTAAALADALRNVAPQIPREQARLCVQSVVGQLTHAAHLRRFLETVPANRVRRPSYSDLVDHVVRFSAAGIRSYLQEGKS
jgi:TetR/AcrR family transcriptional regulator, regulator of cefoperazone and chloramphenicol sensitivity